MFVPIWKYKKLERMNEILTDKVQNLTDACIVEQKEDQLYKQVYDRTQLVNFGFDFEKVNAFSIERNVDKTKFGAQEVTIIGYLLNNEVKEWYLYCSAKVHNELVEQFRNRKGTKK